MAILDDDKLIRSIQKKADNAAADALIGKYYGEIYAYAYKQTSDKHTAMDLAQNIFVSMLKTIAGYDSRQAGFRTWLYKIATNKIIDHHRSASRVQNKTLNLDDIDIAGESSFGRHMENKDLASRIQAYVSTFDAETQRIFRLKIYGEYTFAEIAKMTEIPEATAKTKYYRLLKTIRKEFDHEYHT